MSAELLERARAEIAAQRPWKARQRLEGSLANDPANPQVLELLGEICYGMGDLPAAGAYWFLTEREGDDVAAATAALHERYPTPAALFTALPVKARPEAYAQIVRARLEHLLGDEQARWLWTKKLAGVGRKGHDPRSDTTAPDAAMVGIGVVVLAPWLIGIGTLGYAAYKAARRRL